MSSLLDQVEVKVARAERAFTRLRKIIVAAGDDLESHQLWLDRNRASRARELKDQRQLSNKMAIWTFTRFAFCLPVLLPIAIFRQFCASTPALRPTKTAPDETKQPQLQHRIRGLDGPLCTMKPADLHATAAQTEICRECSPNPISERFRAIAALGSVRGRVIISALGLITLFVLTAGAVRATMPGFQADVPLPASPKVAPAALPAMALTAPLRSASSAASVSGFSLIEATLVPEPQPLSAHSTVSMMTITSPVTSSPIEGEASKALVAGEPPAVKPKVNTQTKRKLPSEKPQELSWWQRLPWIRVR